MSSLNTCPVCGAVSPQDHDQKECLMTLRACAAGEPILIALVDQAKAEIDRLRAVLVWYASNLRPEDRINDNGDKALDALGLTK